MAHLGNEAWDTGYRSRSFKYNERLDYVRQGN